MGGAVNGERIRGRATMQEAMVVVLAVICGLLRARIIKNYSCRKIFSASCDYESRSCGANISLSDPLLNLRYPCNTCAIVLSKKLKSVQ